MHKASKTIRKYTAKLQRSPGIVRYTQQAILIIDMVLHLRLECYLPYKLGIHDSLAEAKLLSRQLIQQQ